MKTYSWIALGGAIGACARYALTLASLRLLPPTFPWGTFIVNVLGCFLFGLTAGLALSRGIFGPDGRAFLLVGVLGGFTTYSSFAFESVELIRNGTLAAAAAHIGGQFTIAVAALWAGLLLTR